MPAWQRATSTAPKDCTAFCTSACAPATVVTSALTYTHRSEAQPVACTHCCASCSARMSFTTTRAECASSFCTTTLPMAPRPPVITMALPWRQSDANAMDSPLFNFYDSPTPCDYRPKCSLAGRRLAGVQLGLYFPAYL